MTQVLYGNGDKYVDVTHLYKGYIPRTDESRSAIFGGDPVVGVKKNVKLISEKGTEVYEVGQYRLPDRLTELHKRLKLKGGQFTDELDEQVMAVTYLQRHHKVLEIGADIGTNTCIIASLCDTPPVVVECNNAIESTLRQNVKSNGLDINLEMGALTKGKLIYRHTTNGYRIGQHTIPLKDGQSIPEGYSEIRSIDYDYLVQKYHRFDVVVADCEGAFYYIIQDFPQILDDISMLIIENDYKVKGQKQYVDEQLIQKGFTRVYRNVLQFNYNVPHKDCFYEVWQKLPISILSNGYYGQYTKSHVDTLSLNSRGLNIVYEVSRDVDGRLFKYKNFDTYAHDYTEEVIQFHTDLVKQGYDHYYIVVHDDASTRLNLNRLSTYLQDYGIHLIRFLRMRYAYYCSYYKGKVVERLTNTDVVGSIRLGAATKITICCTPFRYQFFEEYLLSMIDYLDCNLIVSDELHKLEFREDHYYIFCQMLPAQIQDSIIAGTHKGISLKNMAVINTEQTTIKIGFYAYYRKLMKQNVRLLDYSTFNGTLLKAEWLPYQYNEYEISRLKKMMAVPKKYDVAMISNVFPRRKQMYDLLRSQGITVLNIRAWKDKRDKLVGQCKILLNIHTHEDALVWEHIRCDRWLFAGMPIVSELCINSTDLDIKDYVHWSPYEKIPSKVKQILDKIDAGVDLPKVPSSVIENRKQHLYSIKKSIHG